MPANSPIQSAADLRGHTIGVPGAYGATYIGLLSLLSSAGLSQSDVHIQSIGYTQVTALLTHKVDAIMGYANNEPLLLQKAGMTVRTFDVNNAEHPLISNGLAAMQSELSAHGGDIKKLVAATLKGVDYVLAHPQDAVNLSKAYVPDSIARRMRRMRWRCSRRRCPTCRARAQRLATTTPRSGRRW